MSCKLKISLREKSSFAWFPPKLNIIFLESNREQTKNEWKWKNTKCLSSRAIKISCKAYKNETNNSRELVPLKHLNSWNSQKKYFQEFRIYEFLV